LVTHENKTINHTNPVWTQTCVILVNYLHQDFGMVKPNSGSYLQTAVAIPFEVAKKEISISKVSMLTLDIYLCSSACKLSTLRAKSL